MQHLGKRRWKRRKSESKSISILVDKAIYFLIGSLITFLFAAIFHFYIYNQTVDNYEKIIKDQQKTVDDLNKEYCRVGPLGSRLQCWWDMRTKWCQSILDREHECAISLANCEKD